MTDFVFNDQSDQEEEQENPDHEEKDLIYDANNGGIQE